MTAAYNDGYRDGQGEGIMKRQALTDGSGRWFDVDSVEEFTEDTRWDGHNRSSCATGSQWEHETLYRTKGGLWVLHHWSQWQGTQATWVVYTAERAAVWLSLNGYDHPAVATQMAALEIK